MEKNKGILFIAAAATLMSTGGLLIKSVQASAMTVAMARAFFAALVFCPFMQWKKIRFGKHLVGLILSYIYLTVTFVSATKMTTAANAIILQCTAPLWLYLGYIITGKKKVIFSELLPRLVILGGILVILFDPANASGDRTKMIGNLLALSAGISYAVEQYFLEKEYPVNDITVVGILNIFMALFIAVFMTGNLLALSAGISYAVEQYFLEKEYPVNDITVVGILNIFMALFIAVFMTGQISFAQVTPLNWGFLVFLGVFQIGISYVLFRKGVMEVSALEASILSLLEPILNPILVFFFLGEAPTIYTVIGFAVILGGIIMTLIPGKKKQEIEEEPILNPILVFFFLGEAPTIYTVIGFAVILGGIIMTLIPGKKKQEIEELC